MIIAEHFYSQLWVRARLCGGRRNLSTNFFFPGDIVAQSAIQPWKDSLWSWIFMHTFAVGIYFDCCMIFLSYYFLCFRSIYFDLSRSWRLTRINLYISELYYIRLVGLWNQHFADSPPHLPECDIQNAFVRVYLSHVLNKHKAIIIIQRLQSGLFIYVFQALPFSVYYLVFVQCARMI